MRSHFSRFSNSNVLTTLIDNWNNYGQLTVWHLTNPGNWASIWSANSVFFGPKKMRFMQTESVLQTENRSEPAKNRFSVALVWKVIFHMKTWLIMQTQGLHTRRNDNFHTFDRKITFFPFEFTKATFWMTKQIKILRFNWKLRWKLSFINKKTDPIRQNKNKNKSLKRAKIAHLRNS